MDITTSEKDVGVIIDNKLSFDMHITEKVNKANSVVGAIRRSFEYLDKDTFKKLYTALVRPLDRPVARGGSGGSSDPPPPQNGQIQRDRKIIHA